MVLNFPGNVSSAPRVQDKDQEPRGPGERMSHETNTYYEFYRWGHNDQNGPGSFMNSLKRHILAILGWSFFDPQSSETTRSKRVTQPESALCSSRADQVHKEFDGSSTEATRASVDGEQLVDSLNRTLSGINILQLPDLYGGYKQCDFIYDIMLQTRQNSWIRRRMVIDFETDINIMSEDVQISLDTHMDPLMDNWITWWNRPLVQPLGKSNANWNICGREKLYSTDFHVVKDAEFDLLLGRVSVRKLDLYRADPEVATRLRSSD